MDRRVPTAKLHNFALYHLFGPLLVDIVWGRSKFLQILQLFWRMELARGIYGLGQRGTMGMDRGNTVWNFIRVSGLIWMCY